MKIKNLRVVPRNPEEYARLVEEYTSIGFDVEKRQGEIVIHAISRSVKNPKKKEKNDRHKHSDRSESRGRRSTSRNDTASK